MGDQHERVFASDEVSPTRIRAAARPIASSQTTNSPYFKLGGTSCIVVVF